MTKCSYPKCEQDVQGIKVSLPAFGDLLAIDTEFCSFQHAIAFLVNEHESYMNEDHLQKADHLGKAEPPSKEKDVELPANLKHVEIIEAPR